MNGILYGAPRADLSDRKAVIHIVDPKSARKMNGGLVFYRSLCDRDIDNRRRCNQAFDAATCAKCKREQAKIEG